MEYKFLFAINHSTGYRNTNEYGWLEGYSGLSGLGVGAISNAVLTSQTYTHTLNYTGDITSKLNMNATAGFEYWKSNFSNNSFSASGFNTNLSQDNIIDIPYTAILQDGSTQNLPNTYVDPTTELQSYFVRAILNYSDKYFLTGTFRADGSSKFGKNNKYGYFPSIAGKWLISNEDFMKNRQLYFLHWRLEHHGVKQVTRNFLQVHHRNNLVLDSYNNASQNNVANPDLKWETTTSYDLGVDYSLLNGRIYGAIDYYDKNHH